MRIALFLPHLGVSGGLGVHCRGLLAALLRTSPADTFAVFTPAEPKQLFPLAGLEDGWQPLVADPRVTFVPLRWPFGLTLAAPLDPALAEPVAAARPDALLCSYYTGMLSPPCPQAVVFHDAGFLDNPEVFGKTARIRRATVDAIRPAISRLVCVSADAKARICAKLPFDPDQADVVHHALSDTPEAMAEAVRTEAPGGSAWGRYLFLPVGAATGFHRRRKNVPTAVAAFRDL
ncbi:MAG: glycosyltransferase, partial [Fimbriiglobus sp.]